ncbi:MAG: ABC transporter permease [Candidatus Polarisedimenticolia bacterium]
MGRFVDMLRLDLLQAIRFMRHRPGFALSAVLTLAVGIGATTATFSILNAVLLRPLPFPQADRIVAVYEHDRVRGTLREYFSIPDFEDYSRSCTSFRHLAAVQWRPVTWTALEEPRRLNALAVTRDYFDVLGIAPMQGRGFAPEEHQQGHHRVVLLGESVWRSHFGSDPHALGQSMTLDGESYTIVGIMPSETRLPGEGEELWLPLAPRPDQIHRGMHNLFVLGRLRDGLALSTAQAEADTILRGLELAYPDDNTGRGATLGQLHAELVQESRPALLLLMAAVAFVLLIGCVNIANLLLARTLGRGREMGIRAALGAGAGRIVTQLLTESLVLALAGGAAGLLLAVWMLQVFIQLSPADIPRLDEVSLDPVVMAFSLGVSMVSSLLFGLAPALLGARMNVASLLNEGGRGTTRGWARSIGRRALVSIEVALCSLLVLSAGLIIRSLWELKQVDPGYDPANLLVATLELPRSKYPPPEGWPILEWPQVDAFQARLLERIGSIPGVASAGLALNSPVHAGWTTRVSIEGRPAIPEGEQEEARYRPAGAEYFRALGAPLKKGRWLTVHDDAAHPRAALVNEAFVRRHFPDEDPVGRRIRIFGAPWEIVGVVGDVRFTGIASTPQPAMYPSLRQAPLNQINVLVRSSVEPAALIPALRQAVAAVDPDLPLFNARPVAEALSRSMDRQRFLAWLLAAFSGAAMLLAAVGIHGVISCSVAERTREMGIRMALGARRWDVASMVLSQAMRLASLGLLAGCAAAFPLTRLLQGMLFGVGAADPVSLVVLVVAVGLVTSTAAYLPARRAGRIDPMMALRQD